MAAGVLNGQLSKEPRMPKPIIRSPTQASGGSKEGVVRYVLAISLVLVVILFVISYIVA
jgi:hypothetical protein